MLKSVYFPKGKSLPLGSLFIAGLCLVVSLPQLFLGPVYEVHTGTLPDLSNIWRVGLPTFSHSESIFWPHLLGNLVVIVVFGVLGERVIGTKRFIALSLVAFGITTVTGYLRDIAISHGVSGVVWSYHVFGYLALLHLWTEEGPRMWRRPA